jgi:carboxyl-terminal processing protease
MAKQLFDVDLAEKIAHENDPYITRVLNLSSKEKLKE